MDQAIYAALARRAESARTVDELDALAHELRELRVIRETAATFDADFDELLQLIALHRFSISVTSSGVRRTADRAERPAREV